MAKKVTVPPTAETRPLFARIPVEQHRRLRLLALNREVRVAELVREALDRYLDKEARDGK